MLIRLDGKTVGTFDLAGTGGWDSFDTTTLSNVSISGGSSKVMRLEMVGVGFNLDKVEFAAMPGE